MNDELLKSYCTYIDEENKLKQHVYLHTLYVTYIPSLHLILRVFSFNVTNIVYSKRFFKSIIATSIDLTLSLLQKLFTLLILT
jgi:hypothetical protein